MITTIIRINCQLKFHHLPLCAASEGQSKSKTCHNYLMMITMMAMIITMMAMIITMMTMMMMIFISVLVGLL